MRAMSDQHAAPPDDLPVVLASEGPHGPVVYAANRAAKLTGIEEGRRVTDMRAFCPELRVEYADVAGDVAVLERLMLWSRRWCPWSVVDGPRGLILDTTGADHLWGGEATMLADMQARFAGLGLTVELAVAPSWGAAWGLARYGPGRAVCHDPGADMAGLPVEALRLSSRTLLLLNRLGLKTVGALAGVPRQALARRFAQADLADNPLMRLDQVMGRLAEPVSSRDELPEFRVQSVLAEPIQDPTPHVPALCASLAEALEAAGQGARQLCLTVYRTDGERSQITLSTARATRDPAHMARLFDGKLERINPGFGFDLITLEAPRSEEVAIAQIRLDRAAEEDAALSSLTDRLVARLGAHAVRRPILVESHLPERRQKWRSALEEHQEDGGVLRKERPIRLLQPPEEVRVVYAVPEGPPAQFIWRRQTYKVARHAGPERIAPEWWKDRPSARLRDYYKVEDHLGRRCWLFREGLYEDGRASEAPRWFVHGVFA